MRFIVAVKQVAIADEAELTPDGRDVDPDFLELALDESDLCATEEALRLRERLGEVEVVAVTVGDEASEEMLRHYLAMGVDRALRVAAKPVDPISTARVLAAAIAGESPDLVLCGAHSADSMQGSTGVALAELLGLPRVACVTSIEWAGLGPACVQRELEGGLLDLIEVETPAVLTVKAGINQPRPASLFALELAEQQRIPVFHFDSGEPAYRARLVFAPVSGPAAEMLSGTPTQVARRILELVRERLA